jgi:hypothetical protein
MNGTATTRSVRDAWKSRTHRRRPGSRSKLDFSRPFEGHNVAEFTLDRNGDGTTLTWAMRGPNRYIGKVMGVFFDMDRMIGKDFETGLANVKALAET